MKNIPVKKITYTYVGFGETPETRGEQVMSISYIPIHSYMPETYDSIIVLDVTNGAYATNEIYHYNALFHIDEFGYGLVITTQVDITNATIRNVANVTSDTPGNNTPGNNTTDVPPEADLEIIKLVSNKTTKKGEIVTWTIVVTNKGPDAASNIYVKDTLPAGVTYKAHTTSKGLFDSNSLTWFITGLNNGESATLTISTLVDVEDTTLVNE